ncbi:MAG: hypothetical protein NZ891_02960, partial [bacterium]|nr:hypothetical protein [bacterium]MDW8163684.1 hypothetical protein [Candidatus Omnitrophota bacterium]
DVAFSLNGEYFTKQLPPYNSGKIGIFSKNGQLLKEINTLGEEEENNDIKGIAWHPNSYVVGVIYHKNGYSDLRLFEVFNGELLRRIIVGNFYHYFVFDEKGEIIYLSVDGKKIEKINLRNTDFVINSGINLPWLNYGWDIGRNPWNKEHGGFSSNKEVLFQKFKFFKEIGVNIVRVFLFCDLRSGIILDEKGKYVFDKYVYKDFGALIDVAEKTNIKILPVLFDYTIADGVIEENNIKVGEYPEIFYDIDQQIKLVKLFEEFFKKVDTKNLIYGWDIINEPENLKIEDEKVEKFILSFINLLRKYRKKEKITIGSISRIYLNNYRKFNIDFYQFHYYDSFENMSFLDYHNYNLLLDKPVIIGELESSNIMKKLTKLWENGYKGVLIWPDEEFLKEGWKFFKSWIDVH